MMPFIFGYVFGFCCCIVVVEWADWAGSDKFSEDDE